MEYILKKALANKQGVGAFNSSSMEITRAILQAAQNLNSAVIVSTSEGEAQFAGLKQMRALIDAWKKDLKIEVMLHLDHGKSYEKVVEAIEAGYDSVQFDGSELSVEENINQLKKITDLAHPKGVFVEGELGYLAGASAAHDQAVEIKETDLTDPAQAKDFVQRSAVDSLAIAIGNSHGISTKAPKIYFDRLQKIQEEVKIPLVLHGGSGIKAEDIKKAISLGIAKINVNTELRLAFSSALKDFLADNPKQTTPYKIMPASVEAVQKVVEEKIKIFLNK